MSVRILLVAVCLGALLVPGNAMAQSRAADASDCSKSASARLLAAVDVVNAKYASAEELEASPSLYMNLMANKAIEQMKVCAGDDMTWGGKKLRPKASGAPGPFGVSPVTDIATDVEGVPAKLSSPAATKSISCSYGLIIPAKLGSSTVGWTTVSCNISNQSRAYDSCMRKWFYSTGLKPVVACEASTPISNGSGVIRWHQSDTTSCSTQASYRSRAKPERYINGAGWSGPGWIEQASWYSGTFIGC